MLQKQLFTVPSEKSQWLTEPQGLFFPLTQESHGLSSLWSIRLNQKVKSGDFPNADEESGVSVALEGGPARYVFRSKDKSLAPIQSWTWDRGEGGHLYLVSPLTLFTLRFNKKSVKASIYPTHFQPKEEMQFPVLGSEHFLYVVSGKATWFDRESDRTEDLKAGNLLQLSRKNLKQEYLNLKLKSADSPTSLLWGVLHYLSDDKRT